MQKASNFLRVKSSHFGRTTFRLIKRNTNTFCSFCVRFVFLFSDYTLSVVSVALNRNSNYSPVNVTRSKKSMPLQKDRSISSVKEIIAQGVRSLNENEPKSRNSDNKNKEYQSGGSAALSLKTNHQ